MLLLFYNNLKYIYYTLARVYIHFIPVIELLFVKFITVVYKAYESHLPKEKWTWLHFLPSSVPFRTPPTFVAGSRLPWGICCFTNTCISGCAPQCGYRFGIWHQAQGPKAGIEKGFQRQWTLWLAGSELVASGSWRVSLPQGSDGWGARVLLLQRPL